MIVIGGVVLGALLGGFSARRQQGKAADIAQYAAAYGIGLGLIGMIVTMIIERSL